MPTAQRNGTTVWKRRTTRLQLMIWGGWLACVAIFVACWQLISEKTIWMFVTDAPRQAADLGERMIPPKLSYMSELWLAVWDTINIATLGTLLAIILAVPTAYCAARNTTPSRAFVRPVALFIIVASRSINSLIWALMPGHNRRTPACSRASIAIGLRFHRLLREAALRGDRGRSTHTQVEAVTATGAAKPQVVTYGIVPQVLPGVSRASQCSAGTINIRESTVLGLSRRRRHRGCSSMHRS